MRFIKKHICLTAASVTALLAAQAFAPAFAFTQGAQYAGAIVAQGHEWITRQSAIEVLGDERILKKDEKDPRNSWPSNSKARNLDINSAEAIVSAIKSDRNKIAVKDDTPYAAQFTPIRDAIYGERWVDIGGFNFIEAKLVDSTNCLDMVTQEAPDVQYDHFMRKPSDINAQGGIDAANESKKRFVNYFVAAAMAADDKITVWDGGGVASEVSVDRRYFLFGRALHLFEDSFSPDHTVRIKDDNYHEVRQVKSYLCASGSEQHAHLDPLTSPIDFPKTGDVIWVSMAPAVTPDRHDWSAYQPSNIRPYALAAIEGTKDAWAAFIRSLAEPVGQRESYARAQAQAVADTWLNIDAVEAKAWYGKAAHRGDTYVKASHEATSEDNGNGRSVDDCMKSDWGSAVQSDKLAEFTEGRRMCLYNIIPDVANAGEDTQLHLPFFWRWRNTQKFEAPPDDWQFGKPTKTIHATITIANRQNLVTLRREGDYVYNDPVSKPDELKFDVQLTTGIPLDQNVIRFNAIGTDLQLSRANSSGLIHLYSKNDTDKTFQFTLIRRQDGFYNIKNNNDNQYVYMDGNGKSYIYNRQSPDSSNAQWVIEGLPEPYLVDGKYGFYGKGLYSPWAFFLNSTGAYMTINGMQSSVQLYWQNQDGSYKIQSLATGKYFSVSTSDKELHEADADHASQFYVSRQEVNGVYLLRTSDGRFLTFKQIEKNSRKVLVDQPCYNLDTEREFMPGARIGLALNNDRVPPPRDDGTSASCSEPIEFELNRDWKAAQN